MRLRLRLWRRSTNQFYGPWFRGGKIRKVMPISVYEKLSARGQEICRFMVPSYSDPPIETGFVAAGNVNDGGTKGHRISPERLHAIRNEFGGSQTGMQFRLGLYAGPKL